MKQKLNTKLRDLLKSKKAKPRKLSELSKTKQNRLAKLNLMLDELRRGKNVQNRRLATWLTEKEYVLRFPNYRGKPLQRMGLSVAGIANSPEQIACHRRHKEQLARAKAIQHHT